MSPFVFSATRNGNGVVLEGFAPDDAVRTQIIANVTRLIPGAQVTSRIDLGDGAPDGFFAAANFALEQLARMSEGSAALSDLALTLRGRASDVANHIALANALRSPPSGARIAVGEIGPPIVSPYVWSIDKDAQGLVLRGAVPDGARKEANVAAVRSAAGGVAVRDEQYIGDGAPPNYAANVTAAITAVPKLDEGRGEIRDAALAVSGKAATQEALTDLRNALQAAGVNVTVAQAVTAPEPARVPDPPEAPPLVARSDRQAAPRLSPRRRRRRWSCARRSPQARRRNRARRRSPRPSAGAWCCSSARARRSTARVRRCCAPLPVR